MEASDIYDGGPIKGLTIRDHFAIQIFSTLISPVGEKGSESSGFAQYRTDQQYADYKTKISLAYRLADDMISYRGNKW